MQTQCTDVVGLVTSHAVKVAQWKLFLANSVWYYQNDKQLNFCTEITFLAELYQFQEMGPLVMNNRVFFYFARAACP